MQQILAEAKGKAGAASQAHLSAIKELPAEERAAQAPELSPDTYDPFQTSLEDPPMPDDVDLPGPPPLVCSIPCDSLLNSVSASKTAAALEIDPVDVPCFACQLTKQDL